MSHERNIELLNRRRIIYRRSPITDEPTHSTKDYNYYEDGTYECYELFRTRAKITTYKSLKWHLLVLWYLNPRLDQDEFLGIAELIADRDNGFTSFNMPPDLLRKIVYEVSMCDLEEPPSNKLRKVILKPSILSKEEKLRIVGELIGRSKKVHSDDIYECMLDMHDTGKKITIGRLAGLLDCSMRTIYRNMPNELKKEKELLNKTTEKI